MIRSPLTNRDISYKYTLTVKQKKKKKFNILLEISERYTLIDEYVNSVTDHIKTAAEYT